MLPLAKELTSTGHWLFRWRSYVPLVLFIPLLVQMRHFDWPMHSHNLQFTWELGCLCVSLVGLAVRVATAAFVAPRTSGRNTARQVAHSLNTTGMYSLVRHPLYLGNFLIWLGIALFSLNWWLLIIFLLAFWLYYERIMLAEEEFLRRKFGQTFSDWAQSTPPFFPRWRRWKSPARPFSLRTVIKRENTTLYGIIVVFFALDLFADWVVAEEPHLEPFYCVLLVLGTVFYLTIRTLKKRTRLLSTREAQFGTVQSDGAYPEPQPVFGDLRDGTRV